MTCICSFGLCDVQIIRDSTLFSKSSFPCPGRLTVSFPLHNKASFFSSTTASAATGGYGTFTWDDVLRISPTGTSKKDHFDLRGYFEKVQYCNRGLEKQSEFIPFVTEDQIVGYIHKGFAEILRGFKDVFTFLEDSSYDGRFRDHVALHPMLKTPHDRTEAVGNVIQYLGEEWIPGIRNELYPVTPSFGAPIFFSMERAAAPYFGIKAYGVHMNGYVEKDGQKYLWIGKRSQKKPTYPGMLDHIVASGLPHGISCADNLVKECEEEAGISRSISIKAVPVGAVSYMDIDRYRYKRDVLFCYDLKLLESFVPRNEDAEVESFKLVPVIQVADVIRNTQFFKPNCSLVIIDFLFRHGYITPDYIGYLDLLRSLKAGDCS